MNKGIVFNWISACARMTAWATGRGGGRGGGGGSGGKRSRLLFRLALPVLLLAALSAYAVLVLQPLAVGNEAMRARIASLPALSARLAELRESLIILERDVDEETPSHRDLLRGFRGWRVEAHTHVSRIAAAAGLEVAAMEWSEAEPVEPAFETDGRRHWLRTGVSIKLVGAWRGHRDFAHNLSRCDCLAQILEERVTASGRPGLVEASITLFIYHPGDGAYV